MGTSKKALTYKKMTGFATTHGQQFEWTLAGLLFLRGVNSGQEFQLATNVRGAGALDDVVFRLKTKGEPSTWTTTFVQLKHKENKVLSKTMLTTPKGDFSLPSYFKSYLEIKQAMSAQEREALFDGRIEDSQFVIFTNATAPGNLGESCIGNFRHSENFLWSGSGSVLSFETEEDILEYLGECGDEGDKFLNQLRIFCGQPKAIGLQELIKEELAKLDNERVGGLNIERLCECYLNNVKTWCEKSNEILDKDHHILQIAINKVKLESESADDRSRLQAYSEQTEKDYVLPVEFEDTALITVGNGLTHIVASDESCRLTCTKIVQAYEGQSLILTCEGMTANKRALLSESRNGDVKRLVVCSKDWRSELFNDYFQIVNEMLLIRDTISVVILSDGTVSEINGWFQREGGSCQDNFKISQLKEMARETIFKKLVNLQGHEIALDMLFNNDYECIDQVLNASLVVDILESAGPLTVGSALPDGIEYYVERTLEQTVGVKSTLFQALQGTVTIRITDCESWNRDLFDKALDFVNLLNDSSSFNHGDKVDVINKLIQSPFVPDKEDRELFTGPQFSLGLYECNCVGLRIGQENEARALRVCLGQKASQQVTFLFISNEANYDDTTKLFELQQSKHLFALADGKLRWVQTHEDFELIRKHIDEERGRWFAPETVIDVANRLVLVCAKPGMGKSTLMARLAKNTKAALPHYFVILIALKDHNKLFAEGKHADALEFLSIAAKMDSPLQRSLLKNALEVSGNFVVIADGFDEVAPRYIEECCHLISSLKETKARNIWLTSRNSFKQILETRFSLSSAKISEFDKKDQKTFLSKYWAGRSSEENLQEFIDHLLEKLSQAIGDNGRNFLGIPLQTQMLAEVLFEGHVTGSDENSNLPNKLDVLTMLEKFMEKKFGIYFQDKAQTANYDSQEEQLHRMSWNDLIASHTNAAMISILGEDYIKSLGLDSILTESSTFFDDIKRGVIKTGFIDEIANDNPRFIHRVFAEFLVANWIAQNFVRNPKLVKSMMYTPDFTVIRYFFNGILCKGCVLHTAVLHENVEQVKTLLESENIAKKDIGGRTALHLAASIGASEDQKENKRRCEILGLIIGKTTNFKVVDNVLGGTPLRYADIARWWAAIDMLLCKTYDKKQLHITLENLSDANMLKSIFEQDLNKLLEFCLDNGLAVEHGFRDDKYGIEKRLLKKACEEGSVKTAHLLIERNANINSTESIDHDLDGRNEIGVLTDRLDDERWKVDHLDGQHLNRHGPLIAATINGRLEIVKLLHKKHVSNLTSSFIWKLLCYVTNHPDSSKYINTKDEDEWSAMNYAAMQGHTKIIKYLISQGGDIQSRDIEGRTPLHRAAEFNEPNSLHVLLNSLQDTDRPNAINACDNDGHSVLYLATLRGNVECIEILIQSGGKLTQVDRRGHTPLMAAAIDGNQEVVECLLNNFNAERVGISLEDYINITDMDGRTAVHHSAKEGNTDVINMLILQGGDTKNSDFNNKTPFILAVEHVQTNVVRALLDALDETDRAAALNSRDIDGNSLLHLAAWGGSVECVNLFVEAGGILSQVNLVGQTPLMRAARGGKQDVVECLLKHFNTEREGMRLIDYINLRDNNNLTAWVGANAECRKVIETFSSYC